MYDTTAGTQPQYGRQLANGFRARHFENANHLPVNMEKYNIA